MNINKEKLTSYIKNLNTPKVLVVGDMALDEMIYGDAERISREAPVLILQHTHTKLILGGASNAAHNIATLNNGKVSVLGVCGDDYQSGQLFEAFELANIDCSRLVKDKTRKTTTKTRISGSITTSITQQIVRVDRQTNTPISQETEEKLISRIEKLLPNFPLVLHGASTVDQDLITQINKYGGKLESANGIPKELLIKAIKYHNIVKINTDTDLRLSVTSMVRKILKDHPTEFDPRKYLGPGRDKTEEIVQDKIANILFSGDKI